MSCHLIDDTQETIEACAACEAFDRGAKSFDVSGKPSIPLCRRHFNAVIDQVNREPDEI